MLPVLELGLRSREQGVDEGLVLFAIHRAIDVGGLVTGRTLLVVARLLPGLRHVDALEVYDRGDGVEERELVFTGQAGDEGGQSRGGEGAGGDDHLAPLGRRRADLAALDGDAGMGRDAGGDLGREAVPVHRQRASRGSLVGVAAAQDQRVQPAHLGMKQPDGVVFPVIRPERVRTDQFGQEFGLVGVGRHERAHFMKHHARAGVRRLPRGLAAGESAADDMDVGIDHGRGL